jgi:uncharacterized protein
MAQKSLPPAHGNWVSGAEFWDRTKETEDFTRLILDGANILLVAQRRMGKTSLMREVAGRLKNRFHCIYLDLEKPDKAEDFIVQLGLAVYPFKGLWEKTKSVFSSVPTLLEGINFSEFGIKLRANISAGDWNLKGDQLFDVLASTDKNVLLLLDEVPIFIQNLLSPNDNRTAVQGKNEAEQFLRWLRANSQKHQKKIIIVLTGSIGLEPILHRVGLSAHINNFTAFQLPPWDNTTCLECLAALAHHEEVVFEEGAAEKLMELMGVGIPHYVQKFFDASHAECRAGNRTGITIEDVEIAHTQRMLASLGDADLSSYYERIEKVLGQELMPLAIELLTEAAVKGSFKVTTLALIKDLKGFEGYGDKTLQNEVLEILMHDGYLKREMNDYFFVSKLLKDWWKRRYGTGYISIRRRVKGK